MWEVLGQNKEWVFSGIGVVFLGALIRMATKAAFRGFRRLKSLDGNGFTPSSGHVGRDMNALLRTEELAPCRLWASVMSAPLLQQDSVAGQFVGAHVTWSGSVMSAVAKGGEKARYS